MQLAILQTYKMPCMAEYITVEVPGGKSPAPGLWRRTGPLQVPWAFQRAQQPLNHLVPATGYNQTPTAL